MLIFYKLHIIRILLNRMQSHLGFVIMCNSDSFRFGSLMELFCPTHNSLLELFPFCEMQNMGGKLTGTNLVVRPPVSRNISRTKTITIVDKESFCLLSDGQLFGRTQHIRQNVLRELREEGF